MTSLLQWHPLKKSWGMAAPYRLPTSLFTSMCCVDDRTTWGFMCVSFCLWDSGKHINRRTTRQALHIAGVGLGGPGQGGPALPQVLEASALRTRSADVDHTIHFFLAFHSLGHLKHKRIFCRFLHVNFGK